MSRSPLVDTVVAPWLLSLPLLLVLLCPGQILAAKVTLGIAQWGDTHGMFDLMKPGNLPTPCDVVLGSNCVGGIPLLMSFIKDTKEEVLKDMDNYLSISTGNLVSGENGYLGLLGWEKYGEFLNGIPPTDDLTINPSKWYKPHMMSLGIKEFEAGLDQTFDYLDKAHITTLLTNVNCDNHFGIISSELKFCNKTSRVSYQTFTVKGNVQIGLVGFLNPLANKLADAGKLTFTDPADAIAAELAKQDLNLVKFVIAVGTGNYEMSKSIIDKSGGKVKLVIYGGGTKDMTNNYPAKYNDDSYIATIGAKYATRLGWMKLAIDSDTGKLEMEGSLREVVNGTITMDGAAAHYFASLKTKNSSVVAKTRVKLDGAPCWKQECNLGNLVTDSMVHCAHAHDLNDNSFQSKPPYTDEQVEKILKGPIISIWHGGALLKSDVEPGLDVKILDVHKWLPYHNRAYLVKILGSTLRKLFDSSAEALQDTPVPNWGQFLQVSSGVQVIYNDKKVSRIRTIHMNEDGVPQLEDIDDDKEYDVVIPSFMYIGKSVWDYMPGLFLKLPVINDTKLDIGFDDDCLKVFMEKSGFISTGFDERIFLSDESGGGGPCKRNTGLTVFLTLFITAIIFGSCFGCWRFVIQPRRANNNCF